MPTSYLFQTQYTQLDPMTWCATANVNAALDLNIWGKASFFLISNKICLYPINLYSLSWQYYPSQAYLSVRKNSQNQRRQQRTGVRQLLQELLNKLKITDTLDESQFPYRLVNNGYYVCFSHSNSNNINNKVAVVISRRHTVGIDIETNDIAWHVARRFYHSDEITALQALPVVQRRMSIKLLWQIKESFIKINHYKLAQGLGMSYEHIIADTIVSTGQQDLPLTITDDAESCYRIAFLHSSQTVVIF